MHKELQSDQQQRWKAGDHVSVETYVRRYPDLNQDNEGLCDLILSEILLREAAGETPRLEEYLQRYPNCAQSLVQRYRADLATAMPSSVDQTLNIAPSHSMETIQLDEAGQLAAQQKAFDDGMPKIPGYKIVSELGRGGMGVVYRARQLSADRDVALKIVRSDVLDTLPLATRTSTLERFKHEAHAAARLQHDNLVAVFDVGDSGSLRYYAMRFVDGTSLYDMLRNQALDGRTAAQYLEPIARGLQYAHEQGVLHRDVKPHNIIIERSSDRPLLTDFGLAKFLEQRDALTHAGEVMGTPSYMSPEQSLDSGKVTAAADIYSLGAALYHVLTSRPPFQAANVAETIRQVLHEEPVAPRRLNPAIDRDLETICLKCLQKEPTRRYASAGELADDLHRYLVGEPIMARPVGVVERTVRWCRRNPRLALAGTAASVLLVFWITSIVSAYYQATAAVQRSHVLIDDLFTKISEDELLNEPGMQELRQKLLQKALVHYEELLQQSGGSQLIQDEVATAHFRVGTLRQDLGEYDEATKELTAASEQQQKLLLARPKDSKRLEALSDTLNALGRLLFQRQELEEAARQYEEADQLRSQLVELDRDNLDWQRKLANVRMNLGIVELNRGQDQVGRRHIQQAQEQRLAILKAQPELATARRDLATGYFMLGKFDSLSFFNSEESRDPEEAKSAPEEAKPAIANLKRAIEHFNLLSAADEDSLSNRYNLSAANRLLGGILAETDDIAAALDAYDAATVPMTSLAVGNPKVNLYQIELAQLATNQAALYDEQDNFVLAEEAGTRAQKLLKKLLSRDPTNDEYRRDLANAYDAMGEYKSRHAEDADDDKFRSEKLTEAIGCYQSAAKLVKELQKNTPKDQTLDKWLKQILSDIQEKSRLPKDSPPMPAKLSAPAESAENTQ